MNESELRLLLQQVETGALSTDDAFERLRRLPFSDLGAARIDNHRELRQGYPEVVLCQGKTAEQVRTILRHQLDDQTGSLLATRAGPAHFDAVRDLHPDLRYNPLGRTITLQRRPPPEDRKGPILIVTAGTADLPVAEEAAETAAIFGNPTERLNDVGVAGLHRLLAMLDQLRAARVLIVVAGMEGALPSVIAGLVERPVIAVPTSVGYGAHLGGIAALLGMLNSCAGAVGVVNIDNGYGAACLAHQINRL
jgi:NCAIR mutase (PurE)-related protein